MATRVTHIGTNRRPDMRRPRQGNDSRLVHHLVGDRDDARTLYELVVIVAVDVSAALSQATPS